MHFLIKENWRRLNNDIWQAIRKLTSAPADMYIELLRFRLLAIGKKALDDPENVEALNNPEKARERFNKLPVPETEDECLSFLAEYYRILRQFETQIAEEYRKRLSEWIIDHNLRYRTTDECELELTISGFLVTEYEFLKKALTGNNERIEALNDLEQVLPKLEKRHELRNCIQTASNLLEGIIIDRSTISANTLTRALPGCKQFFPHQSLMDCVENIYKFLSDYPNVRHAGDPAHQIRGLKKDDALLILALTVGFGTFIFDNDASGKILKGDI